jgi:hypothetical protein
MRRSYYQKSPRRAPPSWARTGRVNGLRESIDRLPVQPVAAPTHPFC